MKKIATFVCAALAAMIMASCSSNSPKGVVKDTMQCIIDKDFKGLVDNMYVDDESLTPEKAEEAKKMYAELLESKYPNMTKKNGKLKSFKVVSEEMSEDGNSAVVEVEETWEKDGEAKTETEKLEVKKDKNGNWKLKL